MYGNMAALGNRDHIRAVDVILTANNVFVSARV